MGYLWDEAKRAANLAKHGVDFADAVGALEDPAALTLEDGEAQGECRYVTLGMGFTGRVLLVMDRAAGRQHPHHFRAPRQSG